MAALPDVTSSANETLFACADLDVPIADINSGNASCPCISSLASFGVINSGSLSVGIEGINFDYGSGYGENGCAAHDALLPPYCKVVLPTAGDSVDITLPLFCFQPWCYVNASACAGSGVLTSPATYNYTWWRPEAKAELSYSYDTCDTPDLYSLSLTESQLLAEEAQRLAEELAQREQQAQMATTIWLTTLGVVAALLVLAVCTWRELRRRRIMRAQMRRRLRLVSNNQFANSKSLDSKHFHVFLSYAWQSGQDQMHVVKERLLAMQPDLRVFRDQDDLEEGKGIEYLDRSYALCHR